MTRLPDFVIVGAMKAGTTTLFRWLESQPEFVLPDDKEPGFFADDSSWADGVDSYARLFSHVPPAKITGEASVVYTDPDVAERAATRMAATIPEAVLIYVVRHPLERLRSHYRHEVQRSRERRSFLDAVADPGGSYVRRSMYFTCIEPYIGRFPRERLCVVRTEDLEGDGWAAVLERLSVPHRPPPGGAHNVTDEKPQYTRLMLRLWESGRLDRISRLPGPMRRLGRRLLTRTGGGYERHLAEADAPVPEEVATAIWKDVARLEAWLERSLWPQAAGATGSGLGRDPR